MYNIHKYIVHINICGVTENPICLHPGPFPDLKGEVCVAGTNSNQNSQIYFQKSPNL